MRAQGAAGVCQRGVRAPVDRLRLRFSGRQGGELDPECSAVAGRRIDFDLSTVLADDSMDGGEAEPGPCTRLFGRAERFEQVTPGLVRHAEPRIANREFDKMPFARPAIGCRDRQFSTLRHGIAGIDDQIEQYLTELAGVGMDQIQRWLQIGHQANVVSDKPQQQRFVV